MDVLVTSKIKEDPNKNDFSNTKGQLTPQTEVGSGRNSYSSEIL